MQQDNSTTINSTPGNSTTTFRILKLGSCPTLSGKGLLGYQIGTVGDGEIQFRMTSNNGGGYFSPEWVSIKSILAALEKGPKPLTSFALSKIFIGKSVNNPSFMFAALLAEGLVKRDEDDHPRCYIAMPPDEFMSGIQKLIDAGADIKVASKVVGKGVVKVKTKAIPEEVVPVLNPPSKGKPKKVKPIPDANPESL